MVQATGHAQVVINEAQSRLPAPHQVPPPPPGFTGRGTELGELLRAVREGGVAITGVRGLGGVGKTALALVLADRLKADYPDAQFFVDLHGVSSRPVTPREAMEHVIRGFEPAVRLPDDEQQIGGLYRSVLADRRVLLVFDNAADAGQVEPLRPPAGCLMLVTSRRHLVLSGIFSKTLDELPEDEAETLLLKICPRIGEWAEKIATLAGRLPVALVANAGSLSANPVMTPAQLAGRLAKADARLQPVSAAFSVSYDLLSEPMRACWRRLAIFPGSFDVKAAATVWRMDEPATCEAAGGLVQASVVEHSATTDRLRLHDLVRDYLRTRATDGEMAEAARLHAEHFCRMLGAADEVYLKGGAENAIRALGVLDAERINIEAGHRWAAAQPPEDTGAAGLCVAYPDAGVHVLSLRQHARERISWLTTASSAARRIGDRRGEGNALGNLGLAYAALGETRKAIEHHAQALTISREIGDRRGEGQDLGNLGNAYADLGETRKAIEHYETQLRIAREIGDRRGEGAALGNLGNAYADLGETRKAIEHYEAQVKIVREIGDRRGEGNALFNSAMAFMKLDRKEEALGRAEQALHIFEQIESPHVTQVCETIRKWRQAG